jgi:hypothetical protein
MRAPVNRSDAWWVCGSACAVVALVCAAAASRIRTFSHAADCLCVLSAVAAYVVAVAAAWRIRPRAAAVAAVAALLAPLLALPAVVTRLSFGSAFVLLFVVSEMTAPPEHTEEMGPTLSCRVYGWGAAFGDEGYTVYVYRHPPFVPLVQFEVAHVRVNETERDDGPRSASCASVAAPLRW